MNLSGLFYQSNHNFTGAFMMKNQTIYLLKYCLKGFRKGQNEKRHPKIKESLKTKIQSSFTKIESQ